MKRIAMNSIRVTTAMLAVTAALALMPAQAHSDDEKNVPGTGVVHIDPKNDNINKVVNSPSNMPASRGAGGVVMPGQQPWAQQGGGAVAPQPQEPKKNVRYVYDKSQYGLFSHDMLPKRLFNNVNPKR